MPSTPNYAIRYPCADAAISCSDFQNFALDAEAAITSVATLEARALRRPIAGVNRSSLITPTTAAGATSTMTYDTELFDNNAMVDLVAANDRIIVRRAGVYLAKVSAGSFFNSATVTSYSYIIRKNGTDIARRKWPGVQVPVLTVPDDGSVQAMSLCAVSDFFQVAFTWTGTGGPITDGDVRFVLQFVCDPS